MERDRQARTEESRERETMRRRGIWKEIYIETERERGRNGKRERERSI